MMTSHLTVEFRSCQIRCPLSLASLLRLRGSGGWAMPCCLVFLPGGPSGPPAGSLPADGPVSSVAALTAARFMEGERACPSVPSTAPSGASLSSATTTY